MERARPGARRRLHLFSVPDHELDYKDVTRMRV